jgi:hypothetical protein
VGRYVGQCRSCRLPADPCNSPHPSPTPLHCTPLQMAQKLLAGVPLPAARGSQDAPPPTAMQMGVIMLGNNGNMRSASSVPQPPADYTQLNPRHYRCAGSNPSWEIHTLKSL